MATQVISASASNAQSTAITSTKVRVTPSASVYYAVGANPTASATGCEMIVGGQTRYVNMQGLGNKIAFVTLTGSATVSVTACGTVYQSSIPGSTYIPS